MKQRSLTFAFAVSLLVHIVIIPVALTLMAAPNPIPPDRIDVALVDMQRVERRDEPVAPKPARPVREEKVIPPKLIEKTSILQTEPDEPPPPVPEQPNPPLMNTSKAVPAEPPPTVGEKTLPSQGQAIAAGSEKDRGAGREGKGAIASGKSGAGAPFLGGDVAVIPGPVGAGGGGGDGPVRAARPSVIHQVKPRYPDSARRAGVQGVTLLRVRVLENGLVGEVLVEKSAGFPDLDVAAAEGVRKWRFDPARRGQETIAVWVLLPVRFELR